ncbi:MAG: outer membrane protein assembly factor BamC [Aeromonas sp.]
MFTLNNPGHAARLLLSCSALAVLAACSSPSERATANRNFDYQQVALSGRTLVVPAPLVAPTFKHQFDLPAKRHSDALPVGAAVDIRPPAQLIPVVNGSQAVNATEPTLAFFATQHSQDLRLEIWSALQAFLAKHQVATTASDAAGLRLSTDWFDNSLALDAWSEEDSDYRLRQRYQFTLTPDTARHSVRLSVAILAHEQAGESSAELAPTLHQRYATRTLNQFAEFYQSEIKARQASRAQGGISLLLGQDSNDLPAWIAEADFERVWQQLNAQLPAAGFEINAAQQSLGVIETRFSGSSRLWPWGEGSEGLPSGDYRFQLGELVNGKTSITVFDDKKKPLASSSIAKLHQQMARALTGSTPE